MRRLRTAVRLLAGAVTLGSIALMLWPDRFQATVLGLGLAGQFALGTLIIAAVLVEVLARGTRAPGDR